MLLSVVLLGATADSGYLADAADFKVEKAARDYRIQVYNTFRTDRPEYNRRAAEGRRVLRVWKRNGREESQSNQVIQWFAQATKASRTDAVAVLPTMPSFIASQPSFVDNEAGEEAVEDEWNMDDQYALSGEQGLHQDAIASSEPSPSNSNSTTQAASAELGESTATQGGGVLRRIGQTIFGSAGSDQSTTPPVAAPTRSELELAASQTAPPNPLTDELDVDEIKAQVDGFNASISAIHASLRDGGTFPVRRLADFVSELETLTDRRRDLEPYLSLDVLSATERRHIGNLVSTTETLIALYQTIDEQLTQSNETDGKSGEPLNKLLERVEKLLADPIQS